MRVRQNTFDDFTYHRLEDVPELDYITLDYDIKYETFWESSRCEILSKFITEYPLVKKTWIRMSAGGRVHIWIELTEHIPMLEHFILRRLLIDDNKRVVADMFRIYRGSEIAILFDKKLSRGKMRYASEWMEFKRCKK